MGSISTKPLMNLGSILGLYTIGSPLPTFSCRFNHRRWWSPAEVHVGCPHGLSTWTIQTFEVLSAKRPRQAPHSCPGEPPGPFHERSDAWRGLLALSTSNVWIVHVDSPCGQSTWTSAGDHAHAPPPPYARRSRDQCLTYVCVCDEFLKINLIL